METYKKDGIELIELASFIANLNRIPEHHVGYCGIKADEIKDTLENDFSDYCFTDSFTIMYEDKKIIGALGFDVNSKMKTAEIWGPFIHKEEDWEKIAKKMWGIGLSKLGGMVHSFHGFFNKENKNAQEFMKYLSASEQGKHVILKMHASAFLYHPCLSIKSITPGLYKEFITLHDEEFPDTYYNGETIIGRINECNKLFVFKEEECLLGYIYIEGSPEFKEGNIEYIAVKPSIRNKGIGLKLLNYGLYELFNYMKIEEISICVGEENERAIRLYTKAGFSIADKMEFYSVNI
ncbi:GNAT family N-acetyltransferase [Bacillus sp. NPDC094106]|uniref:GNAT family N-acetyltransferase n=1 Tax=Bacillus sp. NPDC094106 TaxID=3363949 RepID=UPI003828D79B